ncbi:ubiquitin-related domain-containing protein [Pisolithus thermaeus]|nr:ubiquitin-related domain-containing protein [Pisolithus thermaeus]
MAGDRDTLLSMGFDPSRVDWALRATSHRGLQPAMDHLLEHEGEPIPEASASGGSSLVSEITAQSTPAMDVDGDDDDAEALRHLIGKKGPVSAAATAGDVEAKSIRCSVCGKTFKNTVLANYHAEKSGHDQFEESTEEVNQLLGSHRYNDVDTAGKKAKLAELQQKLVAKRADLNKIKEELKAKEMIKEAEQKRKEKADDAKARAAIKAQIEADKKARAEKAAREKALREGKSIVDGQSESNNTTSSSVAVASSSSGVAGKDFKDTRLQIRLASGGTPYTTTLPSDSTLHDVAEFVAAQTLLVNVDTVSFTQHSPRKTFSRTDFNKSLRELGLTPSAVLIAS